MFRIPSENVTKLKAWVQEQDEKVKQLQRDSGEDDPFPNYGCCGGGYTYSFTPTTLGLLVSVTNNVTNESLDLSEEF